MRALRPAGRIRILLAFSTLTLNAALALPTLDDARALHRAGRLSEALDAYRAVAAVTASTETETAGTARNNACVILMNTGDQRGALEECLEALVLRRQVGDSRRLGRTLNNLGLVLQRLGRYAESAQRFREALSLNVELEDAEGQTINNANLGVLATQAGWYSEALTYHDRALELARIHGESHWAAGQSRLARINRAVVLERLGAYREALDGYLDVLGEAPTLSKSRKAALLLNIGVVHRNLGDPVSAVEVFEQAVETYAVLGDLSALANAHLNLGLVRHLNLDQPIGAEQAYRLALRLAEQSGDRSEEIQVLGYLGRLLLERSRLEEAESIFRRCLEESLESGSSEGRWGALAGLAGVRRSRGDLPEALANLERAIEEIERVRGSLSASMLRSDYFVDKRMVYVAAVETLSDLEQAEPGRGHAERALGFVQRAKSRVLLDALGVGASGGAPLEARALAKQVGDDVLLEIFIGETELFLWLVHGSEIEMRTLGSPEAVLGQAAAVHRALSRGAEPPASDLRALSETLLAGVTPLLSNSTRLWIAPDGRLQYVPFELLVPPGADGRPLVDLAPVSYLPSGSALGRSGGDRAPSERMLLGFADPRAPTGTLERPTPASLLVSRFALEPLPESAEELVAIERRLPGSSLLRTGEAATEEAFGRLVAGGARVVHVASHTVVDERPRRGAAILLTPGESSDGLLYPAEIAALEYPVDLTVLAACRTALGSGDHGNALTTLTGAFLAAGSAAVVASLWDVGDAETRAFMEQFYHRLQLGDAPAEALRRAKQRFLSDPEWSRSSLWAGFVLIGDAGPVVDRPFPWLPVIFGATGLVLLTLFAASFFRRHRTNPSSSPAAS